MSKVDLHIHTTASDGKYTPAEIVQKAVEAGLKYIAICDHDSVEGIAPARKTAENYPGIEIINGVEINTDIPAGELHVLGYFYDLNSAELKSVLFRLRNSRVERAQKIVNKLRKMGLKIDFVRVEELAGDGAIGRPHIAQAMLEKGYINSFREAFMKYINRGGPAYVERDKITPAEAVQLIARAGGLPVLAHPLNLEHFEDNVAELKAAGLIGIEVYYNNYSTQEIHTLLEIGEKFSLISTGGSDYHGLDSMNDPPLGTVEVPLEVAEKLIALGHQSVNPTNE